MRSLIVVSLLFGAAQSHAAVSCSDLFNSLASQISSRKSVMQGEAEAFLALMQAPRFLGKSIIGSKIIDEKTILIARERGTLSSFVTTFEIWKRQGDQFRLSNEEGGVQVRQSNRVEKFALSENNKVLITASQLIEPSGLMTYKKSVNINIVSINGGRIEGVDVRASGITDVHQIKKISISENGNATIEAEVNGVNKVVNHTFNIAKLNKKYISPKETEFFDNLNSEGYASRYGNERLPDEVFNVKTIDEDTILIINRGSKKISSKSLGGFTRFLFVKKEDGQFKIPNPEDGLQVEGIIPKFSFSENNKLVALASVYFKSTSVGVQIEVTPVGGGRMKRITLDEISNTDQIKNIHLLENGTLEVNVVINGYARIIKKNFNANELLAK